MATKRETVEATAQGRGCLGKAADDEPVFVLRAKDKFAPILVDLWAQLAESLGTPGPKTYEAYNLAVSMRNWQRANTVHIPD